MHLHGEYQASNGILWDILISTISGCSLVRLKRCAGGAEIGGSNPLILTKSKQPFQHRKLT